MKEKIDLKAVADKLRDRVLFPEALAQAKEYVSKMSRQTEKFLESIPEKDLFQESVDKFKKLKEITPERLSRGFSVGQLRKILLNPDINDDTIILVERIHDSYFEGNSGWDLYFQKGEQWHNANAMNDNMLAEHQRILDGKNRQYSMEDPLKYVYDQDSMNLLMEQFHPPSGAYFNKEENILFIYSHF